MTVGDEPEKKDCLLNATELASVDIFEQLGLTNDEPVLRLPPMPFASLDDADDEGLGG